MAVGKMLKQTLAEQGKTISWFARTTGVNENTLRSLIRRDGDRVPLDTLAVFCDALQIDMLDFLEECRRHATEEGDPRAHDTVSDMLISAIERTLEQQGEGGEAEHSAYALELRRKYLLRNKHEKVHEMIDEVRAVSVDGLTVADIHELERYRDYLLWRRKNANNKEGE